MELTISLPEGDERIALVGAAERNLKIIRETLGVAIAARQGNLKISGESDAVGRAASVLEALGEAARRGEGMERQQLLDLIADVNHRRAAVGQVFSLPAQRGPGGFGGGVSGGSKQVRHEPHESSRHTSHGPRGAAQHSPGDAIAHDRRPGDVGGHAARPIANLSHEAGLDVYARGRRIAAVTEGQRLYLDAIHQHDLTFCCGPAGTGKTYLAVASAASMLKRGVVRKLVLCRPAVEAGERLGFLPGDLQAKVNPYLRPLLDSLHDMMDYEQIQRFMACDLIEVIPLAFMRGRTLNDACIILDEAQNTTKAQMMMFLTRLGHGSKMIVTGDTTQIDLPEPRDCGLIDAVRRLRRVRGAAMVTLDQADIVRHNLVQRIVEAYDGKSKDHREPSEPTT